MILKSSETFKNHFLVQVSKSGPNSPCLEQRLRSTKVELSMSDECSFTSAWLGIQPPFIGKSKVCIKHRGLIASEWLIILRFWTATCKGGQRVDARSLHWEICKENSPEIFRPDHKASQLWDINLNDRVWIWLLNNYIHMSESLVQNWRGCMLQPC